MSQKARRRIGDEGARANSPEDAAITLAFAGTTVNISMGATSYREDAWLGLGLGIHMLRHEALEPVGGSERLIDLAHVPFFVLKP